MGGPEGLRSEVSVQGKLQGPGPHKRRGRLDMAASMPGGCGPRKQGRAAAVAALLGPRARSAAPVRCGRRRLCSIPDVDRKSDGGGGGGGGGGAGGGGGGGGGGDGGDGVVVGGGGRVVVAGWWWDGGG